MSNIKQNIKPKNLSELLSFYFNFYNEDTDQEVNYGFLIGINKDVGVDTFIDSEEFDDVFDRLESKFGVHDWCSHPVHGYKAIGYTTYEVDDPKALMEQWRTAFVGFKGVTSVSPVFELEIDDMHSDVTIFQSLYSSNEALTQ